MSRNTVAYHYEDEEIHRCLRHGDRRYPCLGFRDIVAKFVAGISRFLFGRISWLNAALGYQAAILIGAGVLAVAAWAFDIEVGRKEGPRKLAAGFTFVCVLAACALLASAYDRLDPDSLSSIGVADNLAVAGPVESGASHKKSSGNSAKGVPSSSETGELLSSTTSGESGVEPEAFSSKDESAASGACTCSSPEKFVPPRSSGGGEATQPEEGFGGSEAAEEEQEAAEEAAEELEEEREEAEFESEMGF